MFFNQFVRVCNLKWKLQDVHLHVELMFPCWPSCWSFPITSNYFDYLAFCSMDGFFTKLYLHFSPLTCHLPALVSLSSSLSPPCTCPESEPAIGSLSRPDTVVIRASVRLTANGSGRNDRLRWCFCVSPIGEPLNVMGLWLNCNLNKCLPEAWRLSLI